jgi:2-polyprenyl-3-methyl-5-hydroxy-6-metoxy-1,4-benzoquinol methylase
MAESSNRIPCPLCRCERHRDLDTFPVRDLCIVYRRKLGVDVSSEFPRGLAEFRLTQCTRCGLQFFDPVCSGSAAFYAALSTTERTYYSPDRWEFAEARRHIPETATVLDVGCGDGHFLLQLSQKNKVGLEFNPTAAETARKRGLQVIEQKMEEIASESFDALTLFHVLEHLTDPVEFLQQALRILRPTGLLVISVPNNDAFIGSDLQHPANAPPHHTLRWRAEAFRFLPKLLPVNLVQLTPEPLHTAYIGIYRRVQCLKWIERTLHVRLGLMRLTPATQVASKLAGLWSRLTGPDMPKMETLPDGFSLFAVFQKNVGGVKP